MSSIAKYLVFFIIIATPLVGYSQDDPNLPDSTNIVVERLILEGNESVSDYTLENLVITHTNTTLFGIPGFTPFYGIYKLTGGTFGESPVYLDYQTVAKDIERIEHYYNSIGFFYTQVDTTIAIHKDGAHVSFLIDEGERSYIETIAYTGLPDRAFETKKKRISFLKKSSLTQKQINDSTFQANLPYQVKKLIDERERIVSYLKNVGYAAVTSDSIRAFIKRSKKNKYKLDVLLNVEPGNIFRFGDVHISLTGPNRDTTITFPQKKVIKGEPLTKDSAKIFLKKQYSAQTDWNLLTDQLLFKPGDIYNYERYISTINEFQNLTMMNIRRFGFTESADPPDFDGHTVPVYISLQTLPKHSVSFNLFGLHRYGYGSGAGVTYNNNNLFGGAENLQLGVSGNFEYVTQSTITEAEVDSLTEGIGGTYFTRFEVRADYYLPKLTLPFGFLNDNLFFADSRTRYSISYSESDQLLYDINFNLGFNLRYEVQHNDHYTSYLDLIDLQVLDSKPTDIFLRSIRNSFPEVIEQRILEDFRPQISSILRYTFRNENTDLIQRNYGHLIEYTISLGGNIPFLVDRLFVTPGVIEKELPSPVSDTELSYSQYVKLTADYRRYIPVSNSGIFAYRLFGGYAIPYGKSSTIPINTRFYAGGSNDIRGWEYYTLGPGGLQLNEVAVSGGEIKLLAKVEYRQKFLENFLAADWILSLFADAGNVWYGPGNAILSKTNSGNYPGGVLGDQLNLEKGQFHFDTFYKQIAVGSGLGLRLDFNYLVVRVDFAMRVHDLKLGWLNNDNIYFSFGIGHSF